MYFFPAEQCLFAGRLNAGLSTAFGKLENVHINGTDVLESAPFAEAVTFQAVNIPSLVSMSLISNSTTPTDRWTADVSYAMPQYKETSPSSLDINWLFVNSSCTYGLQYYGMSHGSVDVTYSSTKQCYPLPVQDLTDAG